MLWFGRRPRRDTFRKSVEFVQTLFHEAGTDNPSGQESVKFRMREIEIQRHLLELCATHTLQHGGRLEPGDDGPHPAANGAGAKEPSPFGGCNRHSEASQDHAQSKRSPTPNALT